MATLLSDDGELVLSLSRREKLGALHGDIRVPLSAVEEVVVTERPFDALHGVRSPGTGIPRVIALGTWRARRTQDGRRKEKGFAAVYLRRPGVVVRLRDSEFAWLCVSAKDARDVAARIGSALPQAPVSAPNAAP